MSWHEVGRLFWINFLLITLMMIGGWIYYIFQRNGAILDVVFAFGFIIVAITSFAIGQGYLLRKILLFVMAAIWASRLLGYLFVRYLKKDEEGRFQILRKRFSIDSDLKFLALFFVQGIAILIISWPFVLSCLNPTAEISSFEIAGMIVWLIGFVFETIADRELWQFKIEEQNKEKVCQTGLWNYSRHPNYFFNWLVWIGFFLFALDAPYGYTSLVSPALMWYLLTQVSGIKEQEMLAIQTKGEQYKEYQRKTNKFFPWFPKK